MLSLAPDWGPSGSKSLLHELKTADLWNRDVLNGHFSDYELAQMVTSNAAEISNWQSFVGQIQIGMYAALRLQSMVQIRGSSVCFTIIFL